MSPVIARDEHRVTTAGNGDGRKGDRTGTRALLLLLGVPVVLVVLVLWQFAMQTSAGYNESERVRGWTIVLLELPALLLLFVPVVAGLTLGIRSARLGARRGVVAVWAHAVALFLLLLMAVDGSAESIMTTRSTNVASIALAPIAAVALAVLVLCLRAGRRRTPAVTAGDGRAAFRFRLATGLALAGIAGAFVWLFGAESALNARAGGFPRAAVPGAVTVAIHRTGTYYVYGDALDEIVFARMTIQVTDASGRSVAVRPVTGPAAYLHHGRGGHRIAAFDAGAVGTYRVAVTGPLPGPLPPFAPENAYGDFAVGGSVEDWMLPHAWGAAALLLLTTGAGAVLAVATALRYRAGTSAGASSSIGAMGGVTNL